MLKYISNLVLLSVECLVSQTLLSAQLAHQAVSLAVSGLQANQHLSRRRVYLPTTFI